MADDVQLNDKQHAFVAAYLGDERRNATKAAIKAGYSPKTARSKGSQLLANVNVQAAIAEWREEAQRSAIGDMAYRLSRIDELEAKCWDVIRARRDEYGDGDVVGGATGLVVKQFKVIGGGENAQMVEEHVFDAGLVKTIQGLHEQAAKELGQRTDKVDVSGSIVREFVLVADPLIPVEDAA